MTHTAFMTYPSATVRRGRSQRLVGHFAPAYVWPGSDPSNPLHGSLVHLTDTSVVISDGHKMMVADASEVSFG